MNLNHLIIGLLGIGLFGCAQVSAPTGGPRDETPPELLGATPANGSVNLRPETLTLEFDEFVVVKNLNQQLLISPPIEHTPTWRVKGRTVEISLTPTDFREDQTYVLSFGESIVDLHESNSARDLKWAFSTGPVLDTLQIGGMVRDQMTGQGRSGLKVLLYRATTEWDSIWSGLLPVAVGETDKLGEFNIGYLSAGEYKGFALEDENLNYRWDAGEYVALDSAVVSAGSINNLWYGGETEPIKLPPSIESSQMDSTGMVRVYAPFDETESTEQWAIWDGFNSRNELFSREGDSVFVWVDESQTLDGSSTSLIWSGTTFSDSARMRMLPRAVGLEWDKRLKNLGTLQANEQRTLSFQRFIKVLDPSQCIVYEDGESIESYQIGGSKDSSLTRKLLLSLNEQPDKAYELQLLPGAISTWSGRELENDTLMWVWKTHPKDHFGALQLKLSGIPGPGWLRLDDLKMRVETDTVFFFEGLQPGKLELGFEWDKNQDGIWQKVDPERLQSPELYFYPENQPVIRSNWIIEWDWTWQSIEETGGE